MRKSVFYLQAGGESLVMCKHGCVVVITWDFGSDDCEIRGSLIRGLVSALYNYHFVSLE